MQINSFQDGSTSLHATGKLYVQDADGVDCPVIITVNPNDGAIKCSVAFSLRGEILKLDQDTLLLLEEQIQIAKMYIEEKETQ